MTSLAGHFGSRWSLPTAAFLLALPLMAGCNGCGGGDLVCDDQGRCQICDAYGCHDANEGTGSITSASGGSGGEGGAGSSTTGQAGTGGGVPCDPQATVCGCTTMADCPNGLNCLDGQCLDGCNFDFECGANKVCADGKCVASCDANNPCPTGYACVSGACQPDPANPECTGPTDCTGTGAICVDGFCTTGCMTNGDCPDGQLCDAQTHACFDDPTPQPICGGSVMCNGVGQICGADGYCHYPCATVQECKLIDTRFVACDMSICKTEEEINPECDLTTPCPGSQICISNKCQ